MFCAYILFRNHSIRRPSLPQRILDCVAVTARRPLVLPGKPNQWPAAISLDRSIVRLHKRSIDRARRALYMDFSALRYGARVVAPLQVSCSASRVAVACATRAISIRRMSLSSTLLAANWLWKIATGLNSLCCLQSCCICLLLIQRAVRVM